MTKKILIKIIIIMMIFQIAFVPNSNAINFDDIISDGDSFFQEGENNQNIYKNYDEDGNPIGDPIGTILDEAKLQTTIKNVYNILFALGVALSVIIGAILGIKFMVGSIEEQAKIKETLLPYSIGCIVVFSGFAIWKIVIELGGKIF